MVQVEAISACASCAAKGSCAMVESENKEIEVAYPHPQDFHVGQIVEISMRKDNGLRAVLWAYVMPFVVLISSLLIADVFVHNEGFAALWALLFTAIYFALLFALRKYIFRRFTMEIHTI